MLKYIETSPVQHTNVLRVRLTAGQRVSKKYRKQLWKRECKNLKAIVPTVANKNVSEVEVIEQAVGYIEHLHQAIADRLGVLPCDQMIAALHHMAHMKKMAQDNARMTSSAPPMYCTPMTSQLSQQQQQQQCLHTTQSPQNFQQMRTSVRL